MTTNDQHGSSKGSILVVDDTPVNLRLLSHLLTQEGYEVRPVLKGKLALTAVQSSPPDLILLDIMMPEMNGYEVCQQLKADEKTRSIPIIFISAMDDVQDKVRAFEVGGVDYVTKPFQAEEVLARVETHLALRSTQRELQRRIQELDAFSHTVAHDLKNPVNIISGYIELLREECKTREIDSEPKDFIDAISRTAFKINKIIEELMLLAGLRKTEAKIEPIDMSEVVGEAEKRVADLVAEHNAEIVQPERWPVALGYGPWIEEVWANYISNAIKYGGDPPVVELGATEQSNGSICFWVRDNGPGLTPEQQDLLFTPFERLDQVRVKGHGLGLSIVLRILEKLNGEVGVESEVGDGSVFKFSLPRSS